MLMMPQSHSMACRIRPALQPSALRLRASLRQRASPTPLRLRVRGIQMIPGSRAADDRSASLNPPAVEG
eukprot:2144465-Rhodomonas_salina.1